MYSTKEETIAINKSLENSERKLDDELKKTKINNMNYENWFLIHSGMKKEEDLEKSEVNRNKSPKYDECPLKKNEIGNSEEKNNLPDRTILDYSVWFDRHSTKSEIREIIYTSICKKYYPLILTQAYKNMENICIKDSKRYSYFCFTL